MRIRYTFCAAALWLIASFPASAEAERSNILVDNSADVGTVVTYERELWEAWKNQDFPTIERLTADDYYSVDEHGPGNAVDLKWIRDNFAEFKLNDYRLGGIVGRVLAPDVIALVYNARIVGSFKGEAINRCVSEASIWVKREGTWLNVLLHEITRPDCEESVAP